MPDQGRPRHSFFNVDTFWNQQNAEDAPDPFFEKDDELELELAKNPLMPMAPPGPFFPECSTCGSAEPPVIQICADTCPWRHYHYECLVEYMTFAFDQPCPGCWHTYNDPQGRIERYVDENGHQMVRFNQLNTEPNGYRIIDITDHEMVPEYLNQVMLHQAPILLPKINMAVVEEAEHYAPLDLYIDEEINPYDLGLVQLFNEHQAWQNYEPEPDPLLDVAFGIDEDW